MESGSLRVIKAVPGGATVAALVRDFCRRDEGYVTSFSEPLLGTIRTYVDDDSLVEVVSFPKVVETALSMTGEPSGQLTTGQHLQVAVAHACTGTGGFEDPFQMSRHLPGAQLALGETLRELLDHGIDAEEMRRLAQILPSSSAAKLESLASLGDCVNDTLRSLGRERHTDQLRKCLGAIPDWEGYGLRMLLFAGSEFTPLRVHWIKWAVSHGMEMLVVVDRHATDGQLFEDADRLVEALGVPPEILGDGNVLVRNLFADSRVDGPKAEVEIVVAPDPLSECEWALRRVAGPGSQDLVIYARNLRVYGPLLEATARRLGLSVCIQRREPLLANAFAALVVELLQALMETGVRGLSRLSARSHLGLASSHRRAFLRILDSATSYEKPWEALSRISLDEGEAWLWLTHLADWHNEHREEERSLGEWGELFTTLIHGLPWHQPFHGGHPEARSRDERAMHVLKSTIAAEASIRRVSGDTTYPFPAFVAICLSLWDNADVSLPGNEEGALVVNASESLTEADSVVALGMLEGSFPRRRAEDPVLEDADRWAINEARVGFAPLPDSFTKARREREEFYRLACFARRKLVLSYPATNDDRDNVPAFYLEMARIAAGSAKETIHSRALIVPKQADVRFPSDARIRAGLDGPRDELVEILIESSEASAFLQPKEGESFTPQDLRDAFLCSFLFNAKHRLKLSPAASRARWFALRRLPAEVGLANVADAQEATSVLMAALRDELERLRPYVEDWEMRALESGGHRMVRDWIRNEFQAREAWPRSSVAVNVPFGEGGVRGDVMGLKLEGTLPAVSEVGGFKVAHLYTSGPGKAALTDEQKILYGIYAMSLVRTNGDWPALEFDGGSGKREIVFFGDTPRVATGPKREGLERYSLAQGKSGEEFFEAFRQELKVLLKRALNNVRDGQIRPQPGEHCQRCDYGELCRRHKDFSDEAGFDVL